MRHAVFIIIFLSLVLYFGCFKHQNHEVDQPEWPRYPVEGIVLDSFTKEPVEDCIVTIERGEFLQFRQDNFISASDTTDHEGIFLIDSVAPGLLFPIKFEKEDCYCPHTDTIDVFLFPSDTLNCCYRYALVKVSDAPHIAISDSTFDITLGRGTSREYPVTIFNRGTLLALNWEVLGTSSWISVSPDSGSVPPQGSQTIFLRFYANFDGKRKKWLFIRSNDCYESFKGICVRLVVL